MPGPVHLKIEEVYVTDQEKAARLAASTDMVPVQGTVDVNVPIATLWAFFTHANYWPRWNRCFFWARNKDLTKGQHLIWTFEPIKRWMPYKMPAIANIVEMEPLTKVTWEVVVLPGMYARHTYHVEDLGEGRTRFGSWEQGMGPGFRLTRWFWVRHFTFVKDESLLGAKRLEEQYKNTGALNAVDLPRKSYVAFWVVVGLLIALLAGLIAGIVGYEKYVKVRSTELAPGVRAFFGGGGNSLLVQSQGRSLLVDTKFWPASTVLHRWIESHGAGPVNTVVNTHYHYDHTFGNALYPAAEKIAASETPALMNRYDAGWWAAHPDALPTVLVSSERVTMVGDVEVRIEHPAGAGHTAGDLWVYLPRQNIIATGDLVSHTYYPFLDTEEGGASLSGMIATVRDLAQHHPEAVFVPGHGPTATAGDLLHFADYLEAVQAEAVAAHAKGWTEDEAARHTNLTSWGLSVLPSPHNHTVTWLSGGNDARWAYVLTGSGARLESNKP